MFLPIATSTSIRRTPWVNYGLIAVNVLIFLAQSAAIGTGEGRNGLAALLDKGILIGEEPELYQFFTYQFLHGGFAHLAGNMLFLWVFGNPVNSKMGHATYLLVYLACGVFAATVYAFGHDNPMLGASGSVAGVTTAYLALFPRSHITILYWWFFIGSFELPSTIMIVFKMILWDNVIAGKLIVGSGVAFTAHLGGYAFGFAASCAMLAMRVLPRDQFDIIALWRRRLQRQALRSAMADPNAQARARFGRVARPVALSDVNPRAARDPREDQVTELRQQIAAAFTRGDWPTAAELYEKVLHIDPRHVLSREHQLNVANQLCSLHRFPQAAAAYEKYLSQYTNAPDADEVKLMLGIIYARDLHQYEVAEEHLRPLLDRFTDERRKERCGHWLEIAARALGRPAPE